MKEHPLPPLVPPLVPSVPLANGVFRDSSLVTVAFVLLIIFLA